MNDPRLPPAARRRAHAVVALLLAAAVAGPPAIAATSGDREGKAEAWLLAGERIYRSGVLPDGRPLRATIGRDVVVSGRDAACATCHRRSGWGASEGTIQAPPVNAQTLFAPVTLGHPGFAERDQGSGARPAYTKASLARAIRTGVDAAGRSLRPPMPRYELPEAAMKALVAYLSELGKHLDPGVDQETIRLATVIAGPVEASRREALLGVLRAFEQTVNADTRDEEARRVRGSWVTRWKHEGYRRWRLVVWELSGPPSTWGGQLAALYEKEPVFAVLSGLAAGPWQPIHDFCEREHLPCLFPITDEPSLDASDGYTFYFSRGAALAGEVVAKYLQGLALPTGSPVVQVYRESERGAVAARALRGRAAGSSPLEVIDVGLGGAPVASTVQRALHDLTPAATVLWLEDEDLQALFSVRATAPGGRIVLPPWSLTPRRRALAGHDLAQVVAAYPYALPGTTQARRDRALVWIRARGLAVTDERVQTGAFFAATALGEALRELLGRFSRDYLVERVEHMVDNALTSSVYPRLTLAPGRRFASTGSYIVGVSTDADGALRLSPLTEWVVP